LQSWHIGWTLRLWRDAVQLPHAARRIHGSDICWRKFLNAAKFYGADTAGHGR